MGDGTSPGQNDFFLFGVHLRDRHSRHEGLGIGMETDGAEVFGRRRLHDLPEVHHGDPRAHVLHDAEVMGNENIGQAEFLLKPPASGS